MSKRTDEVSLIIKLYFLKEMGKTSMSMEYVEKYKLENIIYDYIKFILSKNSLIIANDTLINLSSHMSDVIKKDGMSGLKRDSFVSNLFVEKTISLKDEYGSPTLLFFTDNMAPLYLYSKLDTSIREYNNSDSFVFACSQSTFLGRRGAAREKMFDMLTTLYGGFWANRIGDLTRDVYFYENTITGELHIPSNIRLDELLKNVSQLNGKNKPETFLSLYYLCDPMLAYLYIDMLHAHKKGNHYLGYSKQTMISNYVSDNTFANLFAGMGKTLITGSDVSSIKILEVDSKRSDLKKIIFPGLFDE